MAGQILVPFNSQLRTKDLIAAIAEAAKPEATVVFLIPYPVDPQTWLRDHWVATESSRDAVRAGKNLMERYSREGQRGQTEWLLHGVTLCKGSE
jgi:hypothetical protein